MPLEEESSFSSSSDDLGFIINNSDNDIIFRIMQNLLHCQNQVQHHVTFLQQLKQIAKELTSSASRLRVKERCIKRDGEQTMILIQRLIHRRFDLNEHHFHRRFRMRRPLFRHIMEVLGNHSDYFQLRSDATANLDLTLFTKCTATVQILTYDIATNCVDEFLKIGANTILEFMKKFC